MRDQGQLEDALLEFKKAATIDPAGFIAQQEIRRTQVMIEAAKAAAGATPSEPAQKIIDAIPSVPVELRPLSTDPITLNLTDDCKVIYQVLGKLAGINVLIDPEYASRKIHVELHGVTLTEALSLLAAQSKTYWVPMTSNTIFVVADTVARRKDVEPSIVKTFYLSNVSQASDLQDVMNVLRTMLEVGRLTAVPSQNAIIVRGTPDQVTLAGKFIADLDKARPEVIVEVAVMQVNRERIKNLGLQLPTSTTLSYIGNSSSSGSAVTLNNLTNLKATDFSINIPSITANFLMSDSDANLIQNPQIRALDGQKASLKIGERVPIAVGSFTAGSTATSALVNTQFQYIDVGVNIDITPTVHGSHEVTLKVSLDISAVDSEVSIGGIQQPVIGQRRIEHTIRLKEGEVNLLGGLLEDSSTKSLSGYPGLMSIPILKYLFGNLNTDHRQTETVFVLIPHIVRIQDVNPSNLRQLDVGTSSNIDLHLAKIGKPENPPVALPSTPGAIAKEAPSSSPIPRTPAPVNPTPPAQAPGAQPPAVVPPGVVFNMNPAQVVTNVGQNFKVDLSVVGALDLVSVPLRIQYDPALMRVVSVGDGGFLGQGGQHVEITQQDDPAKGTLQLAATRAPNSGGSSGQGIVYTLTFIAKAEGQGTLSIVRAGLRDAMDQSVPASGSPTSVEIRK
jgi:general secretion pathway protein D